MQLRHFFNNRCFLVFCFFILTNTVLQASAVVIGHIDNVVQRKIRISYVDNPINGDEVIFEADVDASGEFIFSVHPSGPILATVQYNSQEVQLFLMPNIFFTMAFDGRSFPNNIRYEGAGSNDNSYMADYCKRSGIVNRFSGSALGSLIIPDSIFDAMKNKKLTDFTAFATKCEERENRFFMQDSARYKITNGLANYMRCYIGYRWGAYRLAYSSICRETIPNNYYDFLAKTKFTQDESMLNGSYNGFIDQYIDYAYRKSDKDTIQAPTKLSIFMQKYAIGKDMLSGASREFVLGRMIMYQLAVDKKSLVAVAPYFNDYMEITSNEQYKKAVKQAFDKTKQYTAEQPAPNFVLRDTLGREVNLSDYKGKKMVYLGFWAGWCAPCIAEMRASAVNKKALMDKDIVFLYVGIDDSKNAWLANVSDHASGGVHVWSEGRKTDVIKKYDVVSLPRYFLIDKNGNFITDFKYASSPDFVSDIERRLNGF